MNNPRVELAKKAIANFNKLTPSLSGFASALAGKPLRVEAGPGTYSDGKVITIKPSITLADDIEHQRHLCDKRDSRTSKILCPACASREHTVSMFFHEISHIVFDSFEEHPGTRIVNAASENVSGEENERKIKDNIYRAARASSGTMPLQVPANAINKYMPILLNAVEDARVDSRMARVRPGTADMAASEYYDAALNGVTTANGELKMFGERDLNTQMSLAILAAAKGYHQAPSMDEYVLQSIQNEKIQDILKNFNRHISVFDSFKDTVRLLVACQELGFFIYDEAHKYIAEPVEEEPEPEEEDNNEDDGQPQPESGDNPNNSGDADPGDSGDGDQDSDSDSDETESNHGDSTNDGEPEPEDDSDEAEPESSDAPSGDDEPGSDNESDEPSGEGEPGEQSEDADAGGSHEGGMESDQEDDLEGEEDADGDSMDDADGSDEGSSDSSASPSGEGSSESEEGSSDSAAAGPAAEEVARPDDDQFGDDIADAQELMDEIAGHRDSADKKADAALVADVARSMEHFDDYSTVIKGVDFIDQDSFHPYFKNMILSPAQRKIPEGLLAPSLLHMRRALADNAMADRQHNKRSGRVNQRVLGRRAWNDDDRLFSKKTVPGKRDYAVLIGIDISGSTSSYGGGRGGMPTIHLELLAAYAQAELCHRMGIKFAVYGHTGQNEALAIYKIKEWDQAWDSKAQDRLFKATPVQANLDGHTLEFYRKQMDKVKATDKIIMYYSDGEMPLENYREELTILKKEIAICKQRGYVLMGVGARTDSPTQHGLITVRIDDITEIQNVVKHLGKQIEMS